MENMVLQNTKDQRSPIGGKHEILKVMKALQVLGNIKVRIE